jgi:hypothetical protein
MDDPEERWSKILFALALPWLTNDLDFEDLGSGTIESRRYDGKPNCSQCGAPKRGG